LAGSCFAEADGRDEGREGENEEEAGGEELRSLFLALISTGLVAGDGEGDSDEETELDSLSAAASTVEEIDSGMFSWTAFPTSAAFDSTFSLTFAAVDLAVSIVSFAVFFAVSVVSSAISLPFWTFSSAICLPFSTFSSAISLPFCRFSLAVSLPFWTFSWTFSLVFSAVSLISYEFTEFCRLLPFALIFPVKAVMASSLFPGERIGGAAAALAVCLANLFLADLDRELVSLSLLLIMSIHSSINRKGGHTR
jgi:hypothetical protein